jgi:hypothetical protein
MHVVWGLMVMAASRFVIVGVTDKKSFGVDALKGCVKELEVLE